jgi:quinol monooxygenase YgiN
MAHQILQINFKFNVPREQFEENAASLAQAFAEVPGCVWKVWLMNEAESEAGGIYLFADEASIENYKGSPLFAAVLSHPALSDHSIKQFEVMEEVSQVTRAPLGATAAAA